MRRRAVVLGLSIATVAAGLGAYGFQAVQGRRYQADLERAKQELLAGRHSQGLRLLRELESRRPGEGEIQYLIGLGEVARGRPERAEAAWAKIAIDDVSQSGRAALKWAELDRERGRLSAAEERLQSALERAGTHRAQICLALVQILTLEGRDREARRLFAGGIAEDPDPVAALKALYRMEVDPFPLEAAREYFASAARLSPDDDRVWLGRAHLKILSGSFDEAESLLKDCLRKRPEDPPVWEMLLRCGMEAGRLEIVSKALSHIPSGADDEVQADELRAWAARLGGDRVAERQALGRWLDRRPGDPRILERLAELAIEEGRVVDASKLRELRDSTQSVLRDYLTRLGRPDALEGAEELARLSKTVGRPVDAAFWSARSRGIGRASTPRADGQVRARSLAEEFPELVTALESLTSRASDGKLSQGFRPSFRDDAASAGLDFVHRSGSAGGRLIPPVTFSGGVAILDFDRDGWLDVFLIQSGTFPPPPGGQQGGDRLFRNRRDGTFEDVTRRAGLDGNRGYGHGVAVGDVDNDGHPDLFVTRWRAYALYRNHGDGTFEDVTSSWGLGGDRDWPTSAAFADLDGDGDLDLYVCHYLAWDQDDRRTCVDPANPTRYNCNPRDFPALPDRVFRNEGGHFVDVTAEAGIVDRDGRGLGVVASDLDGDGKIDLFVANDMSANHLWINREGFRFQDRASEAGVAANAGGGYQAGMGVACGDLDGDGLVDLAVTNFYGESTSYFHNFGRGLFADQSAPSGIQGASRYLLGFGVSFLDVENDGRLDLLTANGHIHDGRPLYPWKMPLQLLRGGAAGRFADISGKAGPPFAVPHIARGLAVGDLDNDGRIDVVVQAQDEPAIYLHNRSEAGHSLTFELEGTASNRDAVGALVTVDAPGARRRIVPRIGGGSYQSASSPRLHVGLGASTRTGRVEVRWPSGRVDRYGDLPADAGYRLREGDGRAVPLPGSYGHRGDVEEAR